MNKFMKIIAGAVCSLALLLSVSTVAYADDIGAGGVMLSKKINK